MHDPYTVNVVLKLFEFRYKLDKKCFLSKIHFTVKCHEKFSSTDSSYKLRIPFCFLVFFSTFPRTLQTHIYRYLNKGVNEPNECLEFITG